MDRSDRQFASERDMKVLGRDLMPDSAPNQLIEHACNVLDFAGGSLFSTAAEVVGGLDSDRRWRSHGDWLLLANRMGAERVFFVGDDPVIVFAALSADAPDEALVEAYRRAWSLSRPRCLFLARGAELRVYALSVPPSHSSTGRTSVRPIEIVERAADVESALSQFQRDRVEAGLAFEAKEFRSQRGGAAHRLIADVSAATDALADAGLDQATAHTLIERTILVRYLEDRQIIVPDYLHAVAGRRPAWESVLAAAPSVPNFGAHSTFVSCLADHDLAYAVFDQLAEDFNGDLFIVEQVERSSVRADHLRLLKALLEGTASARQEPLFLWAYDFGVVPTSLISTMYEVFYQEDVVSKLTGTHFTPAELVEFTLAQTLTDSVLARQPRICDPACGSGIFLVEAFRTIVRYESSCLGRRLTPTELREILLDRIAGIDLNEEAVRLAAFSLYLAYLNYQTPQDIREAGPLPRLIWRSGEDRSVLVVSDVFAPTLNEADVEGIPSLPWPSHSFDVVIGNPPWTEPRKGDRGLPDSWGERRGVEVGDRNRSQLFLWRALDLLTAEGVGAMLVAASAFVATRHTSREFRQAWLQRVWVGLIVNFAQVRRLFFTKGVAPFFLLVFRPRSEDTRRQLVVYETAVPAPAFERTRSMAFARLDRRVVAQQSLEDRDHLWKVYAWGNHRDEALLARLDIEDRLKSALPRGGAQPGYGYQWGSGEPSAELKALPSLRTFVPWGSLEASDFEAPPSSTKRQPDERLYHGQRILVRRGVTAGFGPYSRLVDEPISFRHSIYCLPMAGAKPWEAKTLVGILLSSLGRYRLFMTSSAWGLWYDQVYLHEVLDLPIRMIPGHPATRRIVAAVDLLRSLPDETALSQVLSVSVDPSARRDALSRLDDAVFDLFEMTADERDLVTDFWGRFNHPQALLPLSGSRSGRSDDLLAEVDEISRYVNTFLRQWAGLLAGSAVRLDWQAVNDPNVPVTAVVFRLVPADDRASDEAVSPKRWRDALDRLVRATDVHERDGTMLYREGLVRAVSDEGIVIVKRNESRLWTRSAAREDAEATMLQATQLARH